MESEGEEDRQTGGGRYCLLRVIFLLPYGKLHRKIKRRISLEQPDFKTLRLSANLKPSEFLNAFFIIIICTL